MSDAVRPGENDTSETTPTDGYEAAEQPDDLYYSDDVAEGADHDFAAPEEDAEPADHEQPAAVAARAVDAAAPRAEPRYRRFDGTGTDPGAWDAATEAARTAVEAGECIVLPTDTVYGIGADAFDGDAVQRLLDAKMRGRDMPPPVLIADPSLIRALATDVPDTAKDLVARHWPGPLTVICKIQPSLRLDLGETEGTIALRVPDHELAREILRRTGPMAVSSANLSGKPAALSCDEAVDQLGDRVSVYLDGGTLSATDGAPSTIVDFTQHDHGEVLRRGALSLELLRETLPLLVDLTETAAPEPVPGPQPAPESEPEVAGEPGSEAGPSSEAVAARAIPAAEPGTRPAAGD